MPKDKLKIFMSYAPEDEAMKTELDKALVALKRNKKIETRKNIEVRMKIGN